MKKVTMLLSDRFKTQFMQHADVFEDFKVVVMPTIEATVVDDFGDKNIAAIQRECKDGPYDLIAVFDGEKVYYRNPKVKVISDGEGWVVLDDLLPKQEPPSLAEQEEPKHARTTRRHSDKDRPKAPNRGRPRRSR